MWKALAVGTGAFIIYPVLYFSAIQNGPPAAVNLVNYLWPIVGMIVVANFRRETRSLEMLLAGGFGLAGAALAIVNSNPQLSIINSAHGALPFFLAGLGAVTYGTVSAFVNIVEPGSGSSKLGFLTLSLLMAGVISVCILVVIGFTTRISVTPNIHADDVVPLLLYSALLPCAHLSWLTAVQDRRIPGFTSAFLVPVIATTILAVTVSGEPGRKLYATLTLVVCGIAFSVTREKGIPVVSAVALAALGSIEVSQSLADLNGQNFDSAGSFFSQILIGLVAIFDGFVLSNAIARYSRLLNACSAFYSKAAEMPAENSRASSEEVEALDRLIIRNSALGRQHRAGDVPKAATATRSLRREWSEVDIALCDSVSRYEWLVLVLGSSGVIVTLHAFAYGSQSVLTAVLRAFSTAVVVGVLFAVQDYDRNRPEKIVDVLRLLHQRNGIPISRGSPLAIKPPSRGSRSAAILSNAGLAALILAVIVSIGLNIQ
ncbi:MAG TPA: hypothetical protein VLW83_11365 [Candidatus Acidoferrales bacterium]|nr:hypothetical protein [Candidatus Acidoferrales bacterium]